MSSTGKYVITWPTLCCTSSMQTWEQMSQPGHLSSCSLTGEGNVTRTESFIIPNLLSCVSSTCKKRRYKHCSVWRWHLQRLQFFSLPSPLVEGVSSALLECWRSYAFQWHDSWVLRFFLLRHSRVIQIYASYDRWIVRLGTLLQQSHTKNTRINELGSKVPKQVLFTTYIDTSLEFHDIYYVRHNAMTFMNT